MENHQLERGELLDNKGNLCESGFSYTPLKKYDRNKIKVSKLRIKEWDYYYVGNSSYGVALTVADNGYMSLFSVTTLFFNESKKEISKSSIEWFPLGKLHLPSSSTYGDINVVTKKGDRYCFKHEGKKRRLLCEIANFGNEGSWFRCDIVLEETSDKSLVIATPFKKRKHFYYNQKINNLKASGYFKINEEMFNLNKNSYGVLDWGRGVWTYKNTWYWSSAQGNVNGKLIGFNLGYGFGDTSKASENILYIDKEAYKLNDVTFDIPSKRFGKEDFTSPWTFRSMGGEINLTFSPIYNRSSDTNAIILRSKQNQVFGTFSGFFFVEGNKILIENLPGFAEKVINRW